jgi:hypothetical protein
MFVGEFFKTTRRNSIEFRWADDCVKTFSRCSGGDRQGFIGERDQDRPHATGANVVSFCRPISSGLTVPATGRITDVRYPGRARSDVGKRGCRPDLALQNVSRRRERSARMSVVGGRVSCAGVDLAVYPESQNGVRDLASQYPRGLSLCRYSPDEGHQTAFGPDAEEVHDRLPTFSLRVRSQ